LKTEGLKIKGHMATMIKHPSGEFIGRCVCGFETDVRLSEEAIYHDMGKHLIHPKKEPVVIKKIKDDLPPRRCQICTRMRPHSEMTKHDIFEVCDNCHTKIHKKFSNQDLKDIYNTLESLQVALGYL